MKKLIMVLMLASTLIFGQSQGVNTAYISTPAPPGTFNQFVGTTGTTGQTTYYYWVVAVYPVGMAASLGSVQVTNANATLDSSNYNTITWQSPSSAVTGYWVVRSINPIFPGTGTVAVNSSVIAATTFSQTDQSNSLNSFTFTGIPYASSQIQVNNKDFSVPVVQVMNNGDGNAVLSLSETTSGINHLNVASATTTNPVLVRVGQTTDTNAGITIQSKGTGQIKLSPTTNTNPTLSAIGVASAINGLLVTPAITTAPPVVSIGSTTDTNVGMTFTPKGTGTFAITPTTNTNPSFSTVGVASALNGMLVTPGATGVDLTMSIGTTTDTNVGLNIIPKGTGALRITPTSNTNASLAVVGLASAVNGVLITPATTGNPSVISPGVTGADATAGITISPNTTGTVTVVGGTAGNTVSILGATTATGTDLVNIGNGSAAGTAIKSISILSGTPNTSGNNRLQVGAGVTTKATFNANLSSYQAINYVTAAGSNNAITIALTDSAGTNITQAAGLCMIVKLANTLAAAGNTVALNGAATAAIKSHFNVANNIATAYANTGFIHLCFDGTQYLDMSQ